MRPTIDGGAQILVVDDEDTIRSVIAEVLTDDGHDVAEAASAEEALETFRSGRFPLVLTDIVMKRMSGLDLLREIRLIDPEVVVVVMTSHASVDTATSALRDGAYDYLTKPFDDLDDISAVVDRAIEKRRLVEKNKVLVNQLKQSAEELQDLNSQLRDMAIRDGLTDLHNHRYFRETFERELARCDRHNRKVSLVFIDLDHFKRYNDTHGHLAGDKLLKTLAGLLQEGQRAATTVARYGGEEFVLLVPETDKEGALQLAERVRQRVEQHDFPGGETQPGGRVTMSLGVATYPEDGSDTDAMILAADNALYEAKNSGRNTVR